MLVNLCYIFFLFRGYLLRFAKSNRKPGELVYILCANWFKLWMEYTGYQV